MVINKGLAMSFVNPIKAGWVTCIVATLFPFYSFFQMNMFNVVGPILQQEHHLTLFEVGLLSASYLYAQAACLIMAGLFLDRFSIKRLIMISMILLATGTMVFTLSNSIFVLLLARIITGVAHAFAILSCFQMITRWFPADKNSFLMGVVITVALVGGLCAQAPFLLLVNALGMHYAMLINVAVGYLIVVILFVSLKDPPQLVLSTKNKLSNVSIFHELKKVVSNGQNWLCGFYASCMSFPMLVLGAAWGVSYLVYANQISDLQAAYVTLMIFVGMIIGTPLAGIIADFSKYKNLVLIASPVIMLIMFLAIILFTNLPSPILMTLFFIIGLLSGPQVLVYPMIASNNNKNIVGLALGFSSTIIMLGGALAQTIISGVAVLQGFNIAIFILPITLILCFIAALKIKQKG
jgi:sugar phosphate permease